MFYALGEERQLAAAGKKEVRLDARRFPAAPAQRPSIGGRISTAGNLPEKMTVGIATYDDQIYCGTTRMNRRLGEFGRRADAHTASGRPGGRSDIGKLKQVVMTQTRRFLTAEWKNLLMLNYAVDAALLQPFVPNGTELDAFQGRTYVSLVGFEFNRTRIFGVPIPAYQSFEEVNLRFYVRRGTKRGVVFIRELVPKRAVAAVARFAFNENYSYVPMSHRIEIRAAGEVAKAEYEWRLGSNRCSMWIETEGATFLPAEDSASQFITEHYWGYAAQRGGGCLEYEVKHPQWRVWNAKRAGFTGDVAALYGAEIARVLSRVPDSAFLAEGSPVIVFQGARPG